MSEDRKPSDFDEFLRSAHGISTPSAGQNGGGEQKKPTSAFWKFCYAINIIIWPFIIWGWTYNASLTPEQREAMRIEVEAEKQAAQAKAKAEEEACAKDLSCIGEKHNAAAIKACSPEIEGLAKYDHEWTAWLTRFSRMRWGSKGNDVITYLGDEIKFQNGFGAWHRYRYECDLNVKTGTVLNVRANLGRMQR
ncbi:hypothetical protein [Filomicrobium sp.]|uniref:hypothetical protein n=1 Tax=Filomicrobium sp. TaxID=2024831 RepID=UPI00258C1E93|nr:hypothetical protein [Filomicrobium sp.]MCV0369514.1 hypothetical protein [Filomicrobium sp.]